MSELVEHAPESAVVSSKRRMPGWAIALGIALAATCMAICAIVLTIQNEARYKRDVYHNCLAQVASSRLVINIFGELRDADASILAASTHANGPVTEFGRVDRAGIRKRVEAYERLLELAKKPVNCSRLK